MASCHPAGRSFVVPRRPAGRRHGPRVTRGAASRKFVGDFSPVHSRWAPSVQVTTGKPGDDRRVSPAVSTCRQASIHRLVHKLCRSTCTPVLDGDPSGFLTSSSAAAGCRTGPSGRTCQCPAVAMTEQMFGPAAPAELPASPRSGGAGAPARRWRNPVAVADDFSRPSATAPAYDRQPPQDIPAEQSVLGGMLLSKDAIADVVEALQGADFYRPGAPGHLRLRPRPVRPGRAGRRDHRRRRAQPHRPAVEDGRRGLPAHAHRLDADRGQRRLLRRDRRRAGRAAPAGRGRHPRRPARLRRRRRQGRRRRHRRPRPAGDLRRHREADERGLLAPRGHPAADDGRARRHRVPRRGEPRRARPASATSTS